ncbi:MAG: hypothetical protein WC812_04675 [Candidatus Pacearchaeota archaeon]|jgi:hypothetical protein
MKNKKAQEEMIGFALILVIIGVIILVFFTISIKNKTTVEESYVTDNFIQALLQHSTDCAENYETDYLDFRRLINKCANSGTGKCFQSSWTYCESLEKNLNSTLKNSWQISSDSYYKAYVLKINNKGNELLTIYDSANKTELTDVKSQFNSKGSVQNLGEIDIYLDVYY